MTQAKPGTEEAREAGCECPVIDNHYGRGVGGMGEKLGWWFNQHCPYHRKEDKGLD